MAVDGNRPSGGSWMICNAAIPLSLYAPKRLFDLVVASDRRDALRKSLAMQDGQFDFLQYVSTSWYRGTNKEKLVQASADAKIGDRTLVLCEGVWGCEETMAISSAMGVRRFGEKTLAYVADHKPLKGSEFNKPTRKFDNLQYLCDDGEYRPINDLPAKENLEIVNGLLRSPDGRRQSVVRTVECVIFGEPVVEWVFG